MNKVLIENREYGKTYYLLEEIKKAKEIKDNIYVMDSATEHEEKSLLKMIEKTYSNVTTINEKSIDKIALLNTSIDTFSKYYKEYFPYCEIIKNIHNILCFDLSYFLEIGHKIYDESKDINMYKYYRNLYNLMSEQIALSLILCEKDGIISNSLVITDEIEFPISQINISEYQKQIEFLSAVHPENAFGTFYSSFNRIHIKKYTKKEK